MKSLLFFSPLRKSGLLFWSFVFAAGAALVYVWATPKERRYTLKLATGRIIQPPKRITQFFLDRASKYGLDLELADVEGTENSLDQVQQHKIDLAVVKGGIKLDGRTEVTQVTALDVEPFHLLVKKELAAAVARDFATLQGKRINVNKPPTGTYFWCMDILQFAGFEADRNFAPAKLGNPELMQLLNKIEHSPSADRERRREELPDAILIADAVPSPLVRRLVTVGAMRLLPLPFAPAYILERHTAPPHEVLDSSVLIETPIIPAFMYGVSPAVPAEPCPTIGLRRLLVAHMDVPAEAVARVLALIYDEPSDLDFLDWTKVKHQYDPHPGYFVFEEQKKRILQNTIMRLLEKLVSVLGGLIGGILGIYGYFRYRRLLRFEHYFHEIRRIDLIARGKVDDPDAPRDPGQLLVYLQNKLADLRTAAIAEFAKGRLQGESLILSIFTLIQDTGASLPNLVGDAKKATASSRGERGTDE